MKRSLALLAAAASLLVAATPVSASTSTFHYTDQGSGLVAGWTNVPWNQATIPAGTYWEVDVNAAASLNNGSKSYPNGFCVVVMSITFDASGNGTDFGTGYCGAASKLVVDSNKLTSAQLVGSFQYQDCPFDPQTGECTGPVATHTLAVNLGVAGQGPLMRSHGTGSGSVAGYYHYTTHGTEIDRAGVASGTVTLDGVVINAGGTDIGSHLFSSKSAETDVVFCQPKLGC